MLQDGVYWVYGCLRVEAQALGGEWRREEKEVSKSRRITHALQTEERGTVYPGRHYNLMVSKQQVP